MVPPVGRVIVSVYGPSLESVPFELAADVPADVDGPGVVVTASAAATKLAPHDRGPSSANA
jgi:hypothetical protein